MQEAKAIEVVNHSHLGEIEEDLYTMTGTRPSRKPKKRPKQVQNVINVRHSGPLTD